MCAALAYCATYLRSYLLLAVKICHSYFATLSNRDSRTAACYRIWQRENNRHRQAWTGSDSGWWISRVKFARYFNQISH